MCFAHVWLIDDGDQAALRRSSRGSAMQVRFKTTPLGAGSRPVAYIEGLAFDVLITSLRHFANRRR